MNSNQTPAAGRLAAGRLRRAALWIFPVGYAIFIVGLFLDELAHARAAPWSNDWTSFAAGSRLLGTGNLYSLDAQRNVMAQMFPGHVSNIQPFVSPPIGAWLFQPFARIDPATGITLVNCVNAGILVLAAIFAFRELPPKMKLPLRVLLVLLGVWTIGGVQNLTQWDPLLVLLVVMAWHCHKKEMPFLAGLLLSAFVLKPQLLWLCVPLMLVTRSWRLSAGFGAGLLAWLAGSALVGGPGSVIDWIGFSFTAHLGDSVKYVGIPALVVVLTGSNLSAFISAFILAVVATAMFYRFRREIAQRADVLIPLGVTASLLCSPHLFPDDFAVLTPALLWAGARETSVAFLSAIGYGLMPVVAEFWFPVVARVIFVAIGILLMEMLSVLRRSAA